MSEADRLYNVNKPKLQTSSFATAVGLSFLLLFGYVLGYVVFFLLSGDGGETGSVLDVWGPPLVVGVAVSLIACIPMRFMKKPILVAWGMALLASYMHRKAEGETMEGYLQNKVFHQAKSTCADPDPVGVAGFQSYLKRYQACIPAQQAAAQMN